MFHFKVEYRMVVAVEDTAEGGAVGTYLQEYRVSLEVKVGGQSEILAVVTDSLVLTISARRFHSALLWMR